MSDGINSIKFSVDHLAFINASLDAQSPQTILQWCSFTLPGFVQQTSFGPSGMIMMDMMHKLGMRVPTIFVDTLHHFPETLEHAHRVKEHFDLDLSVARHKHMKTTEEFATKYGERLWEADTELYDYLVKVEPCERTLRRLQVRAMVTGRRRDQGGDRANMPIVEYDHLGRIKVNPLANWSWKKIWEYMKDQNVPYNPLHDRGYKSVGDFHSTVPVAANEDERSGRWKGKNKTECGLHTNPNRAVALFDKILKLNPDAIKDEYYDSGIAQWDLHKLKTDFKQLRQQKKAASLGPAKPEPAPQTTRTEESKTPEKPHTVDKDTQQESGLAGASVESPTATAQVPVLSQAGGPPSGSGSSLIAFKAKLKSMKLEKSDTTSCTSDASKCHCPNCVKFHHLPQLAKKETLVTPRSFRLASSTDNQ